MNVFLVHGTFGNPFENWFPWLEQELDKEGIVCTIPSFPTPEHQTYPDWEKLMNYYCDLGVVNNETILVGHSCGSIFLVHYLLTHRIKVKGLICVSGYNNFVSGNDLMDQLNCSFYIDKHDINIAKYSEKVIAFYGDNDPNIPQKYLNDFAVAIGGQIECINNAGHFNASAGYVQCYDVLNVIKQFKAI